LTGTNPHKKETLHLLFRTSQLSSVCKHKFKNSKVRAWGRIWGRAHLEIPHSTLYNTLDEFSDIFETYLLYLIKKKEVQGALTLKGLLSVT
jgi:hypothetical protein